MTHFPVGIPVALLLAGLGARVLQRAWKARAGTDALVGLYFVGMGIGGPPGLLANERTLFAPATAPIAMAAGHLLLSLGFAALYLFVWRCFGAHSPWRRRLATTGCAALAVLFVLLGTVEGFQPPGGAVLRVTALVRAGALVWALVESLQHWRRMRRRVAVGLASPLVTNRFLLWCLWMGSMLTAIGIAIVVRFVFPDFVARSSGPIRTLVIAPFVALCALAATSLWLAFFAPPAYSRWVEARNDARRARES